MRPTHQSGWASRNSICSDTAEPTLEQLQHAQSLQGQELLDYIKEVGFELSDKQLETIAGGAWQRDEEICSIDGKPHDWVYQGQPAVLHDVKCYKCSKCWMIINR